jgi:NADH-quinone oxidoreductase subunit G
MPKLTVNGNEVEFEQGMTVLQACELAGEEIPRFCYHERLKIAGNCRMCLVQIEGGPPKPAASCAMPAGDGMAVHTNTPMVKKAREGVMEFLLANHPLDCPICDQGGECDLQDQAMSYGKGESRFTEDKRAVKDKYMGPVIKTQMTRCIHCTRCVRFMDDVAGVPELGAVYRGEKTQIGTYIEKGLSSELSGNIVDLCPVGALTSKPYAFRARPWELTKTETIDVHDAVGSSIRVDTKGNEVFRIMPRNNDEINEEWISDKTRFSFEGLKIQRIDRPYIRKRGKLVPASWEGAFRVAADRISETDPSKIAAIAGDIIDVEAVHSLKKLLDELKVESYDCRQDGAGYDSSVRASYIFNGGIEAVDDTDAILIIGANPRYEASVLNARIRRNIVDRNIPVGVIGSEQDLTYNYEYLGKNTDAVEELLTKKSKFGEILNKAKKPMIIIGNSVFQKKSVDKIVTKLIEISEKFGVITKDWNGLSVLQKAAARVGALDVGFVPQNKGRDTNKIISDSKKGGVEVLFLLGADEIDTENLEAPFVIYQGSHGDKGAQIADVIFPGATSAEKSATYVNLEGRVQKTRRSVFPVGEAREDWQIISELANILGKKFFKNIDEVRSSMEKTNPVFKTYDEIILSSWPASKDLPKVATLPKENLEAEKFNFYFTDPICRLSKTLQACNEEFGESKGFETISSDKVKAG